MRARALVTAIPLVLLVAAASAAQLATGPPAPPRPERGAILRVDGDVDVPKGGEESFVLVVGGEARIAGRVGALVVVNGVATLDGARVGTLLVAGGTAELGAGTTVDGEVTLLDAALVRHGDASVAGPVTEGTLAGLVQGLGWFAAMVALGTGLAIVAAAVGAAAVVGGGMRAAGRAMRTDVARTLLAAVVLWLGLPVAAVALVGTLVGLPMGVGVFLFVLPAAWFAGILVSGTLLGDLLVRAARGRQEDGSPYLAALVGTTALLVASALPVLGPGVVNVAGIAGSGALALVLWRRARGEAPPAAGVPWRPAPPLAEAHGAD